jgi:hypothetical protein
MQLTGTVSTTMHLTPKATIHALIKGLYQEKGLSNAHYIEEGRLKYVREFSAGSHSFEDVQDCDPATAEKIATSDVIKHLKEYLNLVY